MLPDAGELQSLKKGKGRCCSCCALGSAIPVLAGVALAILIARNNRVPDIRVPTPIMPAGNTYAEFVRIGEAAGKLKNRSPYSKPQTKFAYAEFEACAKEAHPLVKRFQKALNGPFLHPPTRTGLESHILHSSRFREIARLMSGVATYHVTRKEYGAAAGLLLDTMQMGGVIPRGGSLIQHLVGHACFAIAASNYENLLPLLPRETLHTSLERLSAIRERLVPYHEVVMEEKHSMTAMHLDWIRKPQTLGQYLESIKELISMAQTSPSTAVAWQAKLKETVDAFKFLLADKKRMLDDNRRCYDEIARESLQVYNGPSTVRFPGNPFAVACELVANTGRQNYVRQRAELDLLLLATAILLYHRDHGEYPERPSQLSPAYVPAIPTDPFGGGPFGYKRKASGKRPTLYSIGPDLRDDGGKSVTRQARNGPGDIVTGSIYLVRRRVPKAKSTP